ncbi:MAG: barstar family protein [Acidimicrobiia bacterium]
MTGPRWSDPGLHLAPSGMGPGQLGPFDAGTSVAVCRLAPGASKADLLRAVADALALPGWFGHNWDALLDALCDLGRPAVLIIDGAAHLEEGAATTLVEVAASAVYRMGRTATPLSVVLTEAGATEP